MSGQVIHRVDRKPPHECSPPKENIGGAFGRPHEPDDIFPGDILLCECGKRWRCHHLGIGGTINWDRLRRPMWMTRRNQMKEAT